MKIKNKVYIKATSSISSAGNSNSELMDSIYSKKSGLSKDSNYFYNSKPTIGHIKSNICFFDNLYLQVENILKESSLDDFSDTLLIVGSSVGGMSITEEKFLEDKSYKNIDTNLHNINTISYLLKQKYNFYDDISFSTACTSSANALGYAYEVISKGLYKRALVVGVDSLSQTTVGGFLSLSVLSSSNCRPFDVDRDGMNVAEAIACLLIDSDKIDAQAEICGVGYSSDAHHMTQPHPDGNGAISAMKDALNMSNIKASDITYINAHGTGTQANDMSEAKAIEHIFSTDTFVSSTKSVTGHTLGAAGAIEAIICVESIKKGILPPNRDLQEPEFYTINFVQDSIYIDIEYAMSNSFAFGGNNCSLVFRKVS
jgi:3-oxoacyl-[acyl-carrier-protein] synthase-1